MLLDILKGFIIGICASVPLGPIAILVIQKSLSDGHKAGFFAGLGACLVDTLFLHWQSRRLSLKITVI